MKMGQVNTGNEGTECKGNGRKGVDKTRRKNCRVVLYKLYYKIPMTSRKCLGWIGFRILQPIIASIRKPPRFGLSVKPLITKKPATLH